VIKFGRNSVKIIGKILVALIIADNQFCLDKPIKTPDVITGFREVLTIVI